MSLPSFLARLRDKKDKGDEAVQRRLTWCSLTLRKRLEEEIRDSPNKLMDNCLLGNCPIFANSEKDHISRLQSISEWNQIIRNRVSNVALVKNEALMQQQRSLQSLEENSRKMRNERLEQQIHADMERVQENLWNDMQSEACIGVSAVNEVMAEIMNQVLAYADFMAQFNQSEESIRSCSPVLSQLMRRYLNRVQNNQPDIMSNSMRLLREHTSLSLYLSPLATYASPNSIHNIFFTTLIYRLFSIANPIPPPCQPHLSSSRPDLIAIVGPPFCGKTTLATSLAETLGYITIDGVNLVREALESYEIFTETSQSSIFGTPFGSLLHSLVGCVMSGGGVDDILLAHLAVRFVELRRGIVPGIIFDGIPVTKQGFEVLESAFGNYQPKLVKKMNLPFAPELPGMILNHSIYQIESVPANVEQIEIPNHREVKSVRHRSAKRETSMPRPDLPRIEPPPVMTSEQSRAMSHKPKPQSIFTLIIYLHISSPAVSCHRFAKLCEEEITRSDFCDLSNLSLSNFKQSTGSYAQDKNSNRAAYDATGLHWRISLYNKQWIETIEWLSQFDGLCLSINSEAEIGEIYRTALGGIRSRHEIIKDLTAKKNEMARIHEEFIAKVKHHSDQMHAHKTVQQDFIKWFTERGLEIPDELIKSQVTTEPVTFLEILPFQASRILEIIKSFAAYAGESVYSIDTILHNSVYEMFKYGTLCDNEIEAYWYGLSDDKQEIIRNFIEEFQSTSPLLRHSLSWKESLHYRLDDLRVILFKETEHRYNEVKTLIEMLYSPTAFLDRWRDSFRAAMLQLFRLEIERVGIVRHISQMYFYGTRGEMPSSSLFDEHDYSEFTANLQIASDSNATESKSARDRKSVARKTRIGGEEPRERSLDDMVLEWQQKTITAIWGLVEKVGGKSVSTAGSTDKRRGSSVSTVPTTLYEPPFTNLGGLKPDREQSRPFVWNANTNCTPHTFESFPAPTSQGYDESGTNAASSLAPIMNSAKTISIITQAEAECAERRIIAMGFYFRQLIFEIGAQLEVFQHRGMNWLLQRFVRAMSCVNTITFNIRCAIEEEHALHMDMSLHLDNIGYSKRMGTSSTDKITSYSNSARESLLKEKTERPHFIDSENGISKNSNEVVNQLTTNETGVIDAISYYKSNSLAKLPVGNNMRGFENPEITQVLSFLRAMELIHALRCTSVNNLIHENHFLHLLRESDYIVPDTPHVHWKTLKELFDSFDNPIPLKRIDWRRFMVHLLFWSELPSISPPLLSAPILSDTHSEYLSIEDPNSEKSSVMGLGNIAGPSMEQLMEFKNHLCSDKQVSKADFFKGINSKTYWLGYQKEESYRHAVSILLWNIFSDADQHLDPRHLILFLCYDSQPLRGLQKAIFSCSSSENPLGYIDRNDLNWILTQDCSIQEKHLMKHFSLNEHLNILFSDSNQISFPNLISSPSGRIFCRENNYFGRQLFTHSE